MISKVMAMVETTKNIYKSTIRIILAFSLSGLAFGLLLPNNSIETHAATRFEAVPGTYDDSDTTAILFQGNWAPATGMTGPFQGTLTTSTTRGDQAIFTFTGTRLALSYAQKRNGGKLDASITNSTGEIYHVIISQKRSGRTNYQSGWYLADLPLDTYTLTLTHLSGKTVNLDAIEVFDAPTTPGIGTIDDSDANFRLSGYWQAASGQNGPLNGTLITTRYKGDSATISFTGGRITLLYSKIRAAGKLSASIDGGSPVVIQQKTSRRAIHHQKWQSGALTPSVPHTLVLTNLSNKPVNLDALIIEDLPAAPVTGEIDDADNNLVYQGFWESSAGLKGPANETLTTSNVVGDSVSLSFTGNRLTLLYTKIKGGGSINLTISDGSTVAYQQKISERVRSRKVHQQRITVNNLSDQTHTLVITHTGRGPVNLDAINARTIAPCTLFPADNIWNTPVDTLPVDSRSAQYIASIGASTGLHADFGSGLWDGGPIGIPYNIVYADQPFVSVNFLWADESDPGPYPIPPTALIEGGANSDGDRHVLVWDIENCRLYETYNSRKLNNSAWRADSGAFYDLNSNDLRPAGWTSADAAGLPILPGLVRYDEVAAGEINHALRFTASRTQSSYVWPARHEASDITDPNVPPMGQRFRLKAGFNITPYPPDVQVVLRALKEYGLILADNGSNWYISGSPDERWNNDTLHELGDITGSDFEAVDVSGLMTDPDSGQVSP